MILCVNPNPAIDRTVVVDNFQLDAIHRPSLELALAGGKGCNVARAAKTLGCEATVTGWVGGHAGQFIEEALRLEGIRAAFVRTRGETRTCLSVIDPLKGTLTEIYEKGSPVSPEELVAFLGLFQESLAAASLVTLSGSLPPGVPVDLYARLIEMARAAGVPVVLDSSGEPLRAGLEEGRPAVMKCNRAELAGLLGGKAERELRELAAVREVAAGLAQRWGVCVVITLGAEGAFLLNGRRAWQADAPTIHPLSAVGSGDAFLAGLACGMLKKLPWQDALRLAAAAGAANTLRYGAGRMDAGDVRRLAGQVIIAPV